MIGPLKSDIKSAALDTHAHGVRSRASRLVIHADGRRGRVIPLRGEWRYSTNCRIQREVRGCGGGAPDLFSGVERSARISLPSSVGRSIRLSTSRVKALSERSERALIGSLSSISDRWSGAGIDVVHRSACRAFLPPRTTLLFSRHLVQKGTKEMTKDRIRGYAIPVALTTVLFVAIITLGHTLAVIQHRQAVMASTIQCMLDARCMRAVRAHQQTHRARTRETLS